jgi:glycosyltransferase involved in cell wall biosynthesis
MNVGIFVTGIGVPRGRESNVSGHMQLALRTCQLLLDRGFNVHLITNEIDPDYVLPRIVPASDRFAIHFVPDGRRRGRVGMQQNQKARIRPLGLVRQVRHIRDLTRRHDLGLLHMFGFERVAALGGLLKLSRIGVPVAVTLHAAPRHRALVALTRRVDRILASTEFVGAQAARRHLDVKLLRPGIVRDFQAERAPDAATGPRHRVLFWREATEEAGADLVLAAFERLAPRHPDISFDFAVRQNRFEIAGLDELAGRHDNIHVYRFPYPAGLDLATLLNESICVVLPFRKLTIHPQAAIAESLLAGCATITTDLGSNREVVEDGLTGRLIRVDDIDSIEASIAALLADVPSAIRMCAAARTSMIERWNWPGYVTRLVNV